MLGMAFTTLHRRRNLHLPPPSQPHHQPQQTLPKPQQPQTLRLHLLHYIEHGKVKVDDSVSGDAQEYRSETGGVSAEFAGCAVAVSGDECGVVLFDWDGGLFLGLL